MIFLLSERKRGRGEKKGTGAIFILAPLDYALAPVPRKPRNTPGGLVYHVLNRSVGRMTLFRNPGDYDAFERCVLEAHAKHPTRLLAYCVMPNHWHLIVWRHATTENSPGSSRG